MLVLGQAAIMKKRKNCEDMIFKYCSYQAMTAKVINGTVGYLMQPLKNVPDWLCTKQ